jgi:hypothetical protein
MKSKIFKAAVLVSCSALAATAIAQTAQNLTAQKEELVRSKINLRNELQIILTLATGVEGPSKALLESCWVHGQDDATLPLPQDFQLGVLPNGQILWEGSKDFWFQASGKTIYPLTPLPQSDQNRLLRLVGSKLYCSLAMFDLAKELGREIVNTPTKKSEILVRHVGQMPERLNELFKLNPRLDIGIFVEERNAGFSSPSPSGLGYSSPKVEWLREVIFQKIAAYKTSPILIKYPCPTGICESKFVVMSDGKQLVITRDGFQYLNDSFVGGIASEIDLTGEKNLGSPKKIRR